MTEALCQPEGHQVLLIHDSMCVLGVQSFIPQFLKIICDQWVEKWGGPHKQLLCFCACMIRKLDLNHMLYVKYDSERLDADTAGTFCLLLSSQ